MIVTGESKKGKEKEKKDEKRESAIFDSKKKIDAVIHDAIDLVEEVDVGGMEIIEDVPESEELKIVVEKVEYKKQYFCFYRSGSTDNWKTGPICNNPDLAKANITPTATEIYLGVAELPVNENINTLNKNSTH